MLTCGLLYTNPMPTDQELAVYYSRYYRFDYQMAVSAPKPKHIRKRNNEALGRRYFAYQRGNLLGRRKKNPPQGATGE